MSSYRFPGEGARLDCVPPRSQPAWLLPRRALPAERLAGKPTCRSSATEGAGQQAGVRKQPDGVQQRRRLGGTGCPDHPGVLDRGGLGHDGWSGPGQPDGACVHRRHRHDVQLCGVRSECGVRADHEAGRRGARRQRGRQTKTAGRRVEDLQSHRTPRRGRPWSMFPCWTRSCGVPTIGCPRS